MAQASSPDPSEFYPPPILAVAMALPRKAMKKAAAMKGMKKAMKKTMNKSMKKKAMKKSMKKSMKKAKRVSKIARGKMARSLVFRGKKEKTSGGMNASQLTKNKNGKIVSKKMSALGKKRFASSGLKKWIDAVKVAKQLGVKGFAPVGGKTAAGKALYAKVKS